MQVQQQHTTSAAQETSLAFTKDEFIRQYSVLSASNSTPQQKQNANSYIVKFQACDEVWQIARDMIIDSPTAELQGLGAQILCKKLKTNYLSLSMQQRLELRKFFFDALNQYCLRGTVVLSRLAKTEIALSIAILGFTGIHQDWSEFIEDICAFMKQEGSEECMFMICGLEILEYVGSAESMEKVVPDMKIFLRIRSLFQGQMNHLSLIFNELLVHSNSKVGLKTIECIQSWTGTQFKYQIFLDEQLTRNLLLLFGLPDEELFTKVANILQEGISNSNNADILSTANVSAAMNLIRAEEVAGLKGLINTLISRIGDFVSQKDSNFCRLFAEITTEIAMKFTIIILENSEHSQKLLQLVLVCTQHPNLAVSNTTFDFWVQFYRVLKTNVPDIHKPSSDWLIQPYFDVFRTVLEKSKLPSNSRKSKKNSTAATANNNKYDGRTARQKRSIQLQKKYSLFSECAEDQQSIFHGSSEEIPSEFSFSHIHTDEPSPMMEASINLNTENGQNNAQFEDMGTLDEDGNNDDDDEDEDYFEDDYDSKRPANNPKQPNSDLDQFDQDLTKLRVKDYRIYAQDIFNIVFNVLSEFRGQLGVQSILQILYSLLDKSTIPPMTGNAAITAYCVSVEVCLFVVQTISSNMFPSFIGSNEEGFSFFFDFIVNNPDFPTHKKTISMAMQLFYNAQAELAKSLPLFDSTIKFILKYILDDNLGLMASQTFSCIIREVGQNDALETFKYVAQFFVQNIDRISQQLVLDELIQGVFGFALNLKSPAHQVEAVSNLLILIQQLLGNTKLELADLLNTNGSLNLTTTNGASTTLNRQLSKQQDHLLNRAVSVFQSLLSGFSTESIIFEVKTCVAEFVQNNFNFLTLAFDALTRRSSRAQNVITQFISIFRFVTKIFSAQNTTSSNDLGTITMSGDIYANQQQQQQQTIQESQMLSAVSSVFYDQYIAFLKVSFVISQRNPVLFYETMRIFKMVVEITQTTFPFKGQFGLWLRENFNEYNAFYLDFMTTYSDEKTKSLKQDPDLVSNFYENQIQVVRHYTQIYVDHEYFRRVMQFSFEIIIGTVQYDMARSVLNFYYEFLKNCAVSQMQDLMIQILDTVIDILPQGNSHLLHNIALLLMKFTEVYKDEATQLSSFIYECLSRKEKYAQFTPTQKRILTDSIMLFALQNKSLHQLKSLLTDFYSVCKALLPSTEMFLNYEMQLKGHGTAPKSLSIPLNSPIATVTNTSAPTITPVMNNPVVSPNFLSQLTNVLQARNALAQQQFTMGNE